MISGSYDLTLNIAEKYGAKKMINRHKEDVLKAVKDYTDGNGVDIVIECCGKVNGLEQAIAAVKVGGKLCLLSFYSREKIETHINSIIIKDLNIYGCLGSPNAYEPTINMLKAGKMNTKKIITHVLPLNKADETFKIVYQERDKAIKIVLIP